MLPFNPWGFAAPDDQPERKKPQHTFPPKQLDAQQPTAKATPAKTVDVGDDPRTVPGVWITDGRHVWEILDTPEDDGSCLAENQATGYPISLTVETIAACWLLVRDSEFTLALTDEAVA